MFESIIYAFAIVFILCGMFFVCLLAFDRVFTPESSGYFIVLPGIPGDDGLPSAVYSAFIKANLFTFSKKNEVVVLDLGLSESERRACEAMLDGFGSVVFCPAKEIDKLFVERAEKK